jgi:hypothetical protein
MAQPKYPKVAPLRPELDRDVRMVVLILYRHSRDQVIIERVLHNARDIRGLF